MSTLNSKARLDALLSAYEQEILDLPAGELGASEAVEAAAAHVRLIAQAALASSRSAVSTAVTAGVRRQGSGRRALQPPAGVAARLRKPTERLRATFGLEGDAADLDGTPPGKVEDESTD